MLRTFFDFRRVSTLIAPVLIIALAAIMFASAPAATQTTPADATATPTATGSATATPTATATPDPDATATPTATATLTATATATATATPTATATATATPTVPPANADYDVDNDGLIEIRTLAQLNAVRYDLNGNGKRDSVSAADWTTYTTAFLNAASDMGCKLTDHDSDASTPQQATCSGYELMMDLDFDTDRGGDVDSSDTYPNWTPIGTTASPFTATFKSNSNGATPKIATISNLTISSISGIASTDVGLFGATSAAARIEGVGLVDVNVSIPTSSNDAKIGALVGNNAGKVIACYSTGAIDATAGFGSYAGGLVGYNTGTIDASFSRATVDLEMEAGAIGGSTNVYAGGLAGYNSGTLTATYAAGAVKGKGGSGSVGGLVGYNTLADDAPSGAKTIIASYSIAPVTAVAYATTANAPTPTIGGLTGCCTDSTAITNTITASYWDFMSSGIDDASPTTMPQGKSTRDLTSPTSAAGIYADWDNLTIDGAVAPAPWVFDNAMFHPLLTYGGHTTAISGNQLFVNSGIDGRYGGNTIHPREGMTLYSNMKAYENAFRGLRGGGWDWLTSADGITWEHAQRPRGAWGTFRTILKSGQVGKYVRVKVALTTGGHAYTRVIGKVKSASTTDTVALSFASGHNPPRVGTAITFAALPNAPNNAPVVGLWYRCDTVNDTPPGPDSVNAENPGCVLVGSLASYTPGAADLNHYIRAYIYYKDVGVWERASPGVTPQKVQEVQRPNPWREN